MNDFYISLPSNNIDQFKETNSIASYKTRLAQTVKLDSNSWVVALSSITFTKSWYNVNEDDQEVFLFDKDCDRYYHDRYETNFTPSEIGMTTFHEASEKVREEVRNKYDEFDKQQQSTVLFKGVAYALLTKAREWIEIFSEYNRIRPSYNHNKLMMDQAIEEKAKKKSSSQPLSKNPPNWPPPASLNIDSKVFGEHVRREKVTIKKGVYLKVEDLIDHLHELLKKFVGLYGITYAPTLNYDDKTHNITITPGLADNRLLYPCFGREVEELLGLSDLHGENLYEKQKNSKKEKQFIKIARFEAYRCVDLDAGYNNLYVYTDIVQPSLVGSTFAAVLREVEVPTGAKIGDQISHNFINPHYYPLMLDEFQTIEINIRNELGQFASFKFGRVVVKLHFKNVKPLPSLLH